MKQSTNNTENWQALDKANTEIIQSLYGKLSSIQEQIILRMTKVNDKSEEYKYLKLLLYILDEK